MRCIVKGRNASRRRTLRTLKKHNPKTAMDHFLGQRANQSLGDGAGSSERGFDHKWTMTLELFSTDVDRRPMPKAAVQIWNCASMQFAGVLGTVISFQGLSLFQLIAPFANRRPTPPAGTAIRMPIPISRHMCHTRWRPPIKEESRRLESRGPPS